MEAIGCEDNYLVATETGSGKTEAFLLPLFESFLSEESFPKLRVKEILIYPLNAPANDQMYRIARLIFRDLGDPDITIDQNTRQVKAGSSKEDEVRRLTNIPRFRDDFDGADIAPKNLHLCREEMLNAPPYILITN